MLEMNFRTIIPDNLEDQRFFDIVFVCTYFIDGYEWPERSGPLNFFEGQRLRFFCASCTVSDYAVTGKVRLFRLMNLLCLLNLCAILEPHSAKGFFIQLSNAQLQITDLLMFSVRLCLRRIVSLNFFNEHRSCKSQLNCHVFIPSPTKP